MSKIVDERLRVAKIILGHLLEGPRRWTELEKLTTRISPTYARFQSTLGWLLRKGYVMRLERGLYSITDKGEVFLEAI
ncbi:MAG: hypothetical protein ACETV1_00905 [Candidatus Bathyarchaeia archaeon]